MQVKDLMCLAKIYFFYYNVLTLYLKKLLKETARNIQD